MTGKDALKEVVIEQQTLISEVMNPENHKSNKEIMELYDVISKDLEDLDCLKNMLHSINLCEVLQPDADDFKKLELLEIIKQNLKYDIDGNIVLKMGYKNKNYKTVKEWLDNK